MTLDHVAVLVADFYDKTKIDKTAFPLPVDTDFIKKLGHYLGIKNKFIQVIPIPHLNNKIIYGKIRNFEDHVDIAIAYSLNHCWRRFVICKELSHLILSGKDEEGITKCPKDLIDGLFASSYGILEADVQHEHFAAFFAVEYLMPFEETKNILDDKSVLDTEIAEQYKVPLSIIEHLRTDSVKKIRAKLFENNYEDSQ